jgi:hypothetical protein
VLPARDVLPGLPGGASVSRQALDGGEPDDGIAASGRAVHGDPAIVPVDLHLVGGRVVQTTSLRLVPNERHIHLYLDGSLVAMTGLTGSVSARPGTHTLRAEFVAIDHLPFDPRVSVTVAFTVDP